MEITRHKPGPRMSQAVEYNGVVYLAGQVANDMNAGKVDTLLILGANPAYSATGDLKFGEAMNKVKNKIHLGL